LSLLFSLLYKKAAKKISHLLILIVSLADLHFVITFLLQRWLDLAGISQAFFEITKSQHTLAAQSPEGLALRSSDKIAPLKPSFWVPRK
jgi:hypothetical protein